MEGVRIDDLYKVLKEEVIPLTDIEIAIARYIATNPGFRK